MSAALNDLLDHLDALLRPEAFADYGPNGLQVPGPAEIDHVVTGVSASVELFERAAELDADLVLVHHGLFWGGGPARPMQWTSAIPSGASRSRIFSKYSP